MEFYIWLPGMRSGEARLAKELPWILPHLILIRVLAFGQTATDTWGTIPTLGTVNIWELRDHLGFFSKRLLQGLKYH